MLGMTALCKSTSPEPERGLRRESQLGNPETKTTKHVERLARSMPAQRLHHCHPDLSLLDPGGLDLIHMPMGSPSYNVPWPRSRSALWRTRQQRPHRYFCRSELLPRFRMCVSRSGLTAAQPQMLRHDGLVQVDSRPVRCLCRDNPSEQPGDQDNKARGEFGPFPCQLRDFFTKQC